MKSLKHVNSRDKRFRPRTFVAELQPLCDLRLYWLCEHSTTFQFLILLWILLLALVAGRWHLLRWFQVTGRSLLALLDLL